MYNPAHPSAILREYLDGISVTQAAQNLGVTRTTLSRLLNGHTSITADMALLLSQSLGTSDSFWLNLQSQYDLWQARQNRPTVRPMFSTMVMA